MFRITKTWLLIAALTVCITGSFASCFNNESTSTAQSNIDAVADKVWAFSQTHPNGFTLNIRTMTEPTKGIAVSYAATQNSHSREQLNKVIYHALQHDGYVGGWYSSDKGLYYFDSTRLLPEDQLDEALQFARDNGQLAVYVLSTGEEIRLDQQIPAAA